MIFHPASAIDTATVAQVRAILRRRILRAFVVILIAFALTLLRVPFLKLVGAALLLWIGVKLLVPH